MYELARNECFYLCFTSTKKFDVVRKMYKTRKLIRLLKVKKILFVALYTCKME